MLIPEDHSCLDCKWFEEGSSRQGEDCPKYKKAQGKQCAGFEKC